jgi:hypothetical protein
LLLFKPATYFLPHFVAVGGTLLSLAAVGSLFSFSAPLLPYVVRPAEIPKCVRVDGNLDCGARAEAIMGGSPLVDGHNDLPWQIFNQWQNTLVSFTAASYPPR